jgi:phytoene dehydrogenase-like protein
MTDPVVIVGAGLSGLACAQRLVQLGREVRVIEAADAVGGRVRTDLVEGFRLDRGFQVLLDNYPALPDCLDFQALDLRRFEPGALVRMGGGFRKMADPLRRPGTLWQAVTRPVLPYFDALRILRLVTRTVGRTPEQRVERTPNVSTREFLKGQGFSDRAIERFFAPFFGGVFLERDLATSARMLAFTFGFFATGHATLPALGMQAIPDQMAASLPPKSIRLNARVRSVESNGITLESGETIPASQVVLAVDEPQAQRLLPGEVGEPRPWKGTTCLYFAAERSPLAEPILVLDGNGTGPINNLCVPSDLTASYAPDGAALISVTLKAARSHGDKAVVEEVRQQLTEWYGSQVDAWRLLRAVQVPQALPAMSPDVWPTGPSARRTASGILLCGDYLGPASIQTALASGRAAADAVLTPSSSEIASPR